MAAAAAPVYMVNGQPSTAETILLTLLNNGYPAGTTIHAEVPPDGAYVDVEVKPNGQSYFVTSGVNARGMGQRNLANFNATNKDAIQQIRRSVGLPPDPYENQGGRRRRNRKTRRRHTRKRRYTSRK